MKRKRPESKIVCAVATVYAFLLYLLYREYDDIKNTFFVFDPLFPDEIAKRVENSYRLGTSSHHQWYYVLLYYKRMIREKLPKLDDNTEIFAQDHTVSQVIYLSNKQYTFIEDCPYSCSAYYKANVGKRALRMRASLKGKVGSKLFGPLYFRGFADNPQARALIITKEEEPSFLQGKKRICVPNIDETLWNSFSIEKRKFIMDIFNVDDKLIDSIKGNKILLLTTPFAEFDCVSVEEQMRIFKSIVSNYDESQVVIKPHPRDRYFDYQKLFPQSIVINRPFPSELFKLLGSQFGRVVTTFSAAAKPFIGKVPVDWYGVMNDDLVNEIGNVPAPNGVNIIKR